MASNTNRVQVRLDVLQQTLRAIEDLKAAWPNAQISSQCSEWDAIRMYNTYRDHKVPEDARAVSLANETIILHQNINARLKAIKDDITKLAAGLNSSITNYQKIESGYA